MANNLLQLVQSGTAPKNLKMLIARGSAPLPTDEILEMLVLLLQDTDAEVVSRATETLGSLDKEEVAGHLKAPTCAPSVLQYFAETDRVEPIMQAIISNPAAPGKAVETLALSVPSSLLEKILDNRVRILEFPGILASVKKNPQATAEVRRLVQEIEFEFFSDKKTEYALEEPAEEPPQEDMLLSSVESEIPLEDLYLEGLPVDPDARQAEITKRLSTMPVRQKIQLALFGNREIRTVLIRDTNKEISRAVLHSPKLTESEVEGISSMRGVSEDILREIGNSREWTKSYSIVQNLVRNPKCPPGISQRLLFRLRARDLMMLTRDRSIPDAVRYNATRALNHRSK